MTRRRMSRRDRREVLHDVRAAARALAAYIHGGPEASQARRLYRRRYKRILTRCRRWGSWGLYAFSAGEAARYVEQAGETRRSVGDRAWGRDLVRSSLQSAATWRGHAAGRLPQ